MEPLPTLESDTEAQRTTASIPLIATKLYIPPRRPNLVARPRLAERLNQALKHKLTLISAPPGFGKTTVLSEWIPSSPRCVCWLSLDHEDNDPPRFWMYLITALQKLDPRLGMTALALLQATQRVPTDAVVALLVNDLAAFGDSFALVLDDYHVIDAPATHAGVTRLLEHLPSNVHLALTSRADPSLPLAQFRARNELFELRGGAAF